MYLSIQYEYNRFKNFQISKLNMVLLDSDKIKIRIKELNNSNTELSMNLLRKKVGMVNYKFIG